MKVLHQMTFILHLKIPQTNQPTKQIASEKNLKIDHSGHLISHP